MDKKIVTLNGENGKKIDFSIEAEIEYNDDTYQILIPLKDDLELSSDEALVFRVDNISNELNYELITDDLLLKEIEKIYNEEA